MIQIAQDIRQATGALEEYCWEELCDDNLNLFLMGLEPCGILRNLDSDFNYCDRYFRVADWGNIESCNYPTFDKYDIDEYLDAIEDCPYKYLTSDLQEVSDAFDDYEEACDELEEQEEE